MERNLDQRTHDIRFPAKNTTLNGGRLSRVISDGEDDLLFSILNEKQGIYGMGRFFFFLKEI